MRRILNFELSNKKVLNANTYKTMHWAQKAEKTRFLRQAATNMAAEVGPEHIEGTPYLFDKFTVRVTVFPPTRRMIDPVNLHPTAKALVDGLTDAGWWEDDNFMHLVEKSFVYGGLSGTAKTFIIQLDIIEIEDSQLMDYQLEAELPEESPIKTDSISSGA